MLLRSLGHLEFTRHSISLVSCFALVISVFLPGCGGDRKKMPTFSRAPVAQDSAPVPIPRSKTEDSAQASGNRKNKAANSKISPEDLNDLFEVSSNENFAIMSLKEQDQWKQSRSTIATAPSTGKNSSQFVATVSPISLRTAPEVIVELPANFTAIPEAGYDPQGYPKQILCEIDQSVMVLVPGGIFIQGKNGEDKNAGPEHSIYLDSYYIDTHEVTIESYLKYREYEISLEKRRPQLPSNSRTNPKSPALGMPWRDALKYAQYVGKSLPTEAEWEKAARGTRGFDHPWGFGRAAWHQAHESNQIYPVMSFPTDQSPYGVFDMAGNAGEWCADWYQANAYQQLANKSNQVPQNWKGPRNSEPRSHRVVKGNSSNAMTWHRDHRSLSDHDHHIGFRCVLRQTKSSKKAR